VVSWKAYRTASLSLVRGDARIDEVVTAKDAPPLFIWECAHDDHHTTVGGAFLREATIAIRKLLDDNALLSLETDDSDAVQMVWSRPGIPVVTLVLQNPDDTYMVGMRSSYPVGVGQIDQVMADIAVLAEAEHDMEGVVRKAVEAALEVEQRMIDLFRLMEEMHCDAPPQ
jgi:hypothetical protein